MSNCCDISNPLIRDGVSQRQRQAPALSPDYVKVDERNLADFLVFAFRLARQVHYYDTNNRLAGDWRTFFTTSTPVWIALISKTQWSVLNQTYRRQVGKLRRQPGSSTLRPILLTWAELLSHIRLWYQSLQNYTPLKSIIRGLVKTNLTEPLTRMQGFDLAYEADTGDAAIPTDFYHEFANGFGLDRPEEDDFYDSFASTFGLQLGTPVTDATPIQGSPVQAQRELDEVFQILFQNYRQIIQLAPQYQIHSLEARRDHQPHLTMYIGFLEVLKPAQTDLNRMTQRHLDFFYRQVLQLPERPAQLDHAHLLFELAKFQQEYALKADIRFKAGKDAKGMELFYKLDRDVVLDQAQIVSLKSLFLDSKERTQPGGGEPKTLTGFYASPVANSYDGKGAEFPKDQAVKAWPPFANTNCEEDGFCNHADIGIAIADPILLLQEGNRTITLTFEFEPQGEQSQFQQAIKEDSPRNVSDLFRVDFSGEKGWIPASLQTNDSFLSASQLVLIVELAAGDDPVVPFHTDLQNPALPLDTEFPVVLVRLRHELTDGKAPYYFLHTAKLRAVNLTVDVDAVRNLVLQNDLSVIDPSKPFQPFGPIPKAGSNFYIGSQEVFQKPLTDLQLHIEFETDFKTDIEETDAPDWANHYAGYGAVPDPGIKVQALRGRTWQPSKKDSPEVNLFESDTNTFTFKSEELGKLTLKQSEPTEPVEVWTQQSQNGFLRLQLAEDNFLHDKYSKVLSRQVLAQAMAAMPEPRAVVGAYYWVDNKPKASKSKDFKSSTDSNDSSGNSSSANIPVGSEVIIPNEPYTPVIQSIYLSYKAETKLKLNQESDMDQSETNPSGTNSQTGQVFHLHPFNRFIALDPTDTHHLLPHFDQEGELLIGLANLRPLTSLNLLFQVAEETADTGLKTAEVQWHYLVNNDWKPFEDYQIVRDRTDQLIGSGIVQLAIPSDISNQHTTRLDPSLHWLKVSVSQRSGAIPNIIGLHTQAARVTFTDQGNAPSHLASPLPAGTIAKLVNPRPEIKTISQPYASFGGRPPEKPHNYYIRVSEHLRHKGRTVTIFDFERIVLERFPEIYKVRCINHGQVTDANHLQELVPGSVTLAVIPDLSQRTTTNDLKPRVNVNLLEKIKTDLQPFCSPWVDLQVVNPSYEAIQVEFEVRFKDPYQANFAYYKRELEQAIVGFLSPWTVNQGADIHFGGKVYRSSILNFVEEQPTVDYVLNFKMHQGSQQDIREFVAPTARSILVSVPPSSSKPSATNHIIRKASACPDSKPLASDTLGYTPLNQITLSES